ncbi:MAG: aminotransferase class V-fold PLP-dependent enzyme [Verrucomicrobiota bacterium]|jgi:selenocysteine lyase/cysteine desulfurase|nr:aminotransferase class V-fold PLP-dependent enzyme [Verrucomicrobiota bacterium]
MKLPDLQNNEALRRLEFPVCADKVYLAHAGVSPVPSVVTQAIHEVATTAGLDEQEVGLGDLLRVTRARAAKLLGANVSEVALIGPTTAGLSAVATGLDWQPGDEVLIYQDDFPVNVYPWQSLESHGVVVRRLQTPALGQITPDIVIDQLKAKTRLVALASCHFISGWRIDHDTIGRELRERNVLFCLDAIQTLGAFPTTVEHIDFLAADSHKWLLGPCAAGVFYVRHELQDRLSPSAFGWNNVHCPNYVSQQEIVLRTDAGRYEAGSFNILGIAGLNAALGLLLEVGIDNIAADLRAKREWLVSTLLNKGFEVLFSESENAGGITSCWREGEDMKVLGDKLMAEGIVASVRGDRNGQDYLRFSPHFYNTQAELDWVVNLL